MNANNLSLQEKIGQKFMFGINSHNIDIIINLIEKYHIGGVILYKKNYGNYKEMLSVIKRLKEANKNNKIPLFIAIDQEGGRVNRMPSEFKIIKNVYDMSRKDRNLLYDNGKITGKMLSQIGINMNFAPVLDICEENNSKVLYNRCFYGDENDVSISSMKYIKGLNDNNVISVVKHYPGHGVSRMDSHLIAPYVRDCDKLLSKHMKPFDNSISNGVDAVMVSHLVIKGMTDGKPASISPNFIKKYLRERNNYDGLVITDEINMLSRNILYRFNYVKNAMYSGSDIILVKVRSNENIDKYFKYIDSDNKEYMQSIDDSVERIINIKKKYGINDDILYEGCNVDKINQEIDELNNLCL